VAESGKCLEVAARPAAEIENREGWFGFDMIQQRGDVLAHVMIARAVAKILGALVIVLQRPSGDSIQFVRMRLHARVPGNGFRGG